MAGMITEAMLQIHQTSLLQIHPLLSLVQPQQARGASVFYRRLGLPAGARLSQVMCQRVWKDCT